MVFSVIGMVVLSAVIMLMGSFMFGLILSMMIDDFERLGLTSFIGATVIGTIVLTKIFMGA